MPNLTISGALIACDQADCGQPLLLGRAAFFDPGGGFLAS